MIRRLPILGAVVVAVSMAACGDGESSDAVPITTDGSSDVAVLEDVAYATWKAHTLTLDMYEPAAGDGTIVVHLVSVSGGTPDFYPLALAAQGATVFVVDYPRMGPGTALADDGVGIRAMADSTACAIRFATNSTDDTGEDASIALTGFSLGGAVAAHVALFGADLEASWDEYERTREGPASEVECTIAEGPTDVDAFIGFAGPYDAFVPIYDYEGPLGGHRVDLQGQDPDLWEFLRSPVGVNPNLIIRLVHGETDTIVPYEDSTLFEAALADAGHDVQLSSFPAGHEVPEGLAVTTVIGATNQ